MSEEWIEVGIVVARRRLANPWASHSWHVGGVLAEVPALADWTPMRRDVNEELFFAGRASLSLHPGETAHYRDNLQSPEPRLWVQLRPTLAQAGDERVEIIAVTADPYEGEAMADSGDVLESTRMPAEIAARLQAFFEAHHVERPFFKRKRDRQDPDSLGRRGPILRGGEEE
jgi:Protein of unknown function (DUF3305)